MTNIALHVLGGIVDAAMALVPRTDFEKRSLKKREMKIPSAMGDWDFRETRSSATGVTHRYLYHHGPRPDSPVFLFLHGLIFDGRNFLPAHELSSTWQLVAYDFPESSPAYRGDMNDFRYLLDDFLDTIGIDTVFLCGVSFGGGVALRYAASHARRVKALVLVSTFVMNAEPLDRIQSRVLAHTILKHPDFKLYWLMEKILAASFPKKHTVQGRLRDLVRIKHIDWYRQVLKSITTCEGAEDAMQVKCPVLVLHGTRDKTVPLKKGKSIPRYIPHAKVEIIEGGGHAMMFLQGQQLADRIGAFCRYHF